MRTKNVFVKLASPTEFVIFVGLSEGEMAYSRDRFFKVRSTRLYYLLTLFTSRIKNVIFFIKKIFGFISILKKLHLSLTAK